MNQEFVDLLQAFVEADVRFLVGAPELDFGRASVFISRY